MSPPQKTEFDHLAEDHRDAGLLRETVDFLRDNKKWWLLPIVVVFGLFGALVLLSGTAAAPFIYTLF